MGMYRELGPFLLLSCVILRVIQLCHSQFVNIEVSGRYLVKTGTMNYTVSTYWESTVVITCSSRVTFPSQLTLWKNDEPVTDHMTTTNGLWFEKRAAQVRGKYKCSLRVYTPVSNNSYADFTVSSEVEIQTKRAPVLCASSVGRSGYVGENATFRCYSVSSYYRCDFAGQYSSNVVHFKVLEEPLSGTECKCYFSFSEHERSCRLPNVSVVKSITLSIFTTVNSSQSATSVIEVVCTSNPPRLLYWAVFGPNGILFDLSRLELTSLVVNATINITQSAGETSLRISESVTGPNGIHTVICSTYDTEARVVALYRIPQKSERDCPSLLKPTEMKPTTYDNQTTPDEGSTFAMISTEVMDYSKDCGINHTDQGHEVTTDSVNDYFLMGAVGLSLLGTNLILIVVLLHMRRKIRNATEFISKVTPQSIKTGPDIELHDNPTYLAFTQTEDTLGNGKEEEECNYVNM